MHRLGLPGKVFKRRKRLYIKAKQEPRFRFYTRDDRITRPDVLAAAWGQVAANDGAPGVDGVRIKDIENAPGGGERYLEELRETLKAKRYRPQAVRLKMIPKADGGERPLGILSVRDRVVQTAAKLILEPIMDEPSDRHQPPRKVYRRAGTPQGGVISPLLANLYLHWMDKRFHDRDGPAHFAGAQLVRYADDCVILARYQGGRIRDWVETAVEAWMGLSINRKKTRVIKLREPGACLDFLGYSFRYERDKFGRPKRFLNRVPSAKACAREREKLREMISAERGFVTGKRSAGKPHAAFDEGGQGEPWPLLYREYSSFQVGPGAAPRAGR